MQPAAAGHSSGARGSMALLRVAHGLGAWLRLQVAVELWRWTAPAAAGAVRFGGRVAARHQGPVTEAADGSRARSCCSALRVST